MNKNIFFIQPPHGGETEIIMLSDSKWITAKIDTREAADAFVKVFTVPKGKRVREATLYASALGVYAPYFNGVRIGHGVLMPGWTSYRTRIQYQSYDVTSLIKEENEIYVGVGQGWALSTIGPDPKKSYYYGDRKCFIAALYITYTDGSCETVATDESWEVFSTEVSYSEIYHGERVDMSADIVSYGNATLAEVGATLIPQEGEYVTEQERLAPVSLIITPKGERVIDFGQNMTGYVEIALKAPRGSRTVIHHAEVLDAEGNFYTENYRSARNENVYISSGELDVFKPTYTFQGFRYIRLTEYPKSEIDLAAFTAISVNSEIKRTGKYHTGNAKINQLYHNIIWGQKSNFLDVPTDCPQRDERLGWTGDAQVFCRTAAINFDVEKFFKKWLGDVAIEQEPSGAVHGIIPRPYGSCDGGISAAWGDAACIIPWEIYLAYGNRELLCEHFPMMKKWVEYVRNSGPEEFLWLGGTHYGDWLAMDAERGSYFGATSTHLIASAYFAYSTQLLIKAGEALSEEVSEYRELYKNIRQKFRSYFMEGGMPKEVIPSSDIQKKCETPRDRARYGMTQTAIVLILRFGLCEDSERPALAKKLVSLIEENGMRMSTGFVGTGHILHALSENGYTGIAYELLLQEKCPSWLFSVNRGATTIWEHWDGVDEDGKFWSTDMNSFNHYAYGAVFDWIFGVSSGIKPTERAPGYEKVDIAPHPHPSLGHSDASIESRHGFIRSYWNWEDNGVRYEFEIPDGVTAALTLPSGRREILTGGKYSFFETHL